MDVRMKSAKCSLKHGNKPGADLPTHNGTTHANKQTNTNRGEAQHAWDTQGQLERRPSAQPGVVAGFHGRGFQEHGDWGNICASELVAGFEKYRSALQFIYVASASLSFSRTHTPTHSISLSVSSMYAAHTQERHTRTHACAHIMCVE